MDTIILGDGPLGRAVADAVRARGDRAMLLGRPASARHDAAVLGAADVVVEASRGDAVASNLEDAVAGGCRRFVIATTGWGDDRARVEAALRDAGGAAVAAPNLSLGAALFLRLVDRAGDLFAAVPGFDPYVLEWHRRSKRDRPSGTALEIAHRMAGDAADQLEVVSVRAGSSPGQHLVAWDAPGETVELRLTARDRSAYAAGALAAADWLLAALRDPGLHPFDAVVDDLLGRAPATATTH